jgi:WD40 repeat protein
LSTKNDANGWDLDSGRELGVLNGHTSSITEVAIAPDGMHVVTSSHDKTLKIWDLDSGQVITTFTFDQTQFCCAFADSCTVIAGDTVGRVNFLSLEFPKPQ